jgi:phosphoglycolate phosphatase-like HAD superfamily hydrolase
MARNVLVTWDIDGTLVMGQNNNRQHHTAMIDAVNELLGPCSGVEDFLGHSVNGYMDIMIITEMIEALGLPATADATTRVRLRSEEIFVATATEAPLVLPGIPEILAYLNSKPNVTVALATGNLPGIAWRKMELAGLAQYFPDRVGGFGIVPSRTDAVREARKIAEDVKGVTFDIAVHVGDTPNDAEAALGAGAVPFIVRTGKFQYSVWPVGTDRIFNNMVEGRAEFVKLLGLE